MLLAIHPLARGSLIIENRLLTQLTHEFPDLPFLLHPSSTESSLQYGTFAALE